MAVLAGKRFSLLEAKVILTMVLQRFEPHSPPDDVEGIEAITVRPKNGEHFLHFIPKFPLVYVEFYATQCIQLAGLKLSFRRRQR